MDALSLLLNRFAISAGVFYTGQICGVHGFAGDEHRGHLHIIEEGPVDLVQADGAAQRIDRPTLLFMPRPQQHRLVADDSLGAKVLCATVQFGGCNNNPISDSLPPLLAVRLQDLEGALPLLGLLAREAFGGRPGAQAAVDRLCELLIIQLLRHCLRQGLTTGGTLAGLSEPRLARALVALHREPTRAWELADMAAQAGLSRARFAARFREVTGQTPADYLAGWRMTIAQHLLRSGRAMKQVSAESGYGSSSAFIRAFVRKVGVPPAQWLRQIEDASAAGQRPH
ncbi:AraC family transcriptional regulator [Ramlibacter tataouinensis]|uniref:Transcriptional regulator, AraC family-like protein n=1 Tax=Ramlibacter tataouinensis (strain ATCC BAA-407 / DSM 14655 / LMG 21543 / TTB310) TaxID=365046 RepID=F5Y5W3_RAMTT|nr:AraC family transcriptional regulator [Ramlibacter tataouinensis]AEG91467.1 transcriptional regulator, AraC family-like protein [Ramlibacter tataouinensis TTB310]